MRLDTQGLRLFTLLTALGAVACGGDAKPGGEQSSTEPIAKVAGAVGPLTAPVDGEDTICVTRRMNNAEGGYVRRVTGGLTEGSHHLIVYRSDDTEEKPEPEHCDGLSGIFVSDGIPGIDAANVPIFIAQQRSTEIVMPREPGTDKPIGFRIEPQQMIRYEFHWYNTTQSERQVAGNFELEFIPDSAKIEVVESSFAFWGTVDIAIDRRSSFTTPVIFQEGLTGTKIFATTTHQHKRGVGMRIWSSTGGPSSPDETPITEGLDWAEPPLVFHEPHLAMDGGNGLSYQCEWNNATDDVVEFGEGVNDEMCFLWAYYYPSVGVGFDVCMNIDVNNPTRNICNNLLR